MANGSDHWGAVSHTRWLVISGSNNLIYDGGMVRALTPIWCVLLTEPSPALDCQWQ